MVTLFLRKDESMTKQALVKEMVEELQTLPTPQLQELRAYVSFLRVRKTIDTSQLYFWTKQWQTWEQEAELDKHTGRIVGDGTFRGLLKELKHS